MSVVSPAMPDPLITRHKPLRVLDDRRGHVHTAGALDSLEPRRAIDLEDLGPVRPLQHVDAGDVEAHHAGGGYGRGAVALVELHLETEAAAVKVGAELAGLRRAAHDRD